MGTGENLDRFLGFYEGLAEYMQKNHPEICFYGYGSCFNMSFEPPSDLDGGIIVPEIITDKKAILDISAKMDSLAKKFRITEDKIQFNLLDVETCRDRRFLTYDASYTNYLQNYGKVLAGPNFLNELKDINNKFGEANSSSFNFRAIRNDFLMSCLFGEEKRKRKFLKAIDLLWIKPKKIKLLTILSGDNKDKYELISDELYKKTKKDFIKDLIEIFPSMSLSFFEELRYLKSIGKLEKISMDEGELVGIWGETVETYEKIIKFYIEKFPPKEVSVKTLI